MGDVLAARGVPATAVDAERVLLLPPGYFAARGVVAGDLVGLRVTPKGFEFATVAEPSPCNIGTALTALLDDRRDSPEMLDAGVWTACADDGSLFREPTEPLGDLLASSELVCNGDWIAFQGFDFGAWRAAARGGGDEGNLTDVVSQFAPPPDPTPTDLMQEPAPDRATVRVALEFLADPVVAATALDEIRSVDDQFGVALGVFAESVEPLAPRAARPASLQDFDFVIGCPVHQPMLVVDPA